MYQYTRFAWFLSNDTCSGENLVTLEMTGAIKAKVELYMNFKTKNLTSRRHSTTYLKKSKTITEELFKNMVATLNILGNDITRTRKFELLN